ncbi:glutathione S-transferase family protein [Neptuniibacter pectenicola]|jgi:glutathione S-transferase|uniref:glutathione S-transferase family protein n=1 Tax=Neptuniibacter pectenicola TaxID=1806669 RepID=UPI0008368546|nr:glutathione S-transferase family protein [Neptuniibacter pectenicola]|tara:strand:- start:9581 stop:10219 length:639 start_codon:yes stop_codon:yes gene_type:complete
MTAPIKIYGPSFSTFVRSVMMACELKGLAYEVTTEVNGEEVGFHTAGHKAIHPFTKFPVLLTDQGPIAETVAILHYLENAYGGTPLYPTDAFAQAQVEQWSGISGIYVDFKIVRKVLLEFIFPQGEDGSVRMDKVEAALPGVEHGLAVVADQLAEQPYLCGNEITAADLILIPIIDYIEKAEVGKPRVAKHANLLAYIEKIRAEAFAKDILG